jgi:hypothetical protein
MQRKYQSIQTTKGLDAQVNVWDEPEPAVDPFGTRQAEFPPFNRSLAVDYCRFMKGRASFRFLHFPIQHGRSLKRISLAGLTGAPYT